MIHCIELCTYCWVCAVPITHLCTYYILHMRAYTHVATVIFKSPSSNYALPRDSYRQTATVIILLISIERQARAPCHDTLTRLKRHFTVAKADAFSIPQTQRILSGKMAWP